MPATSAPDDLGLRVEGLEIRHGGRLLLSVPELTIAPGSSVAVRGASGAGKSTLLHALSGLLPPTAGQVIWGATDLGKLGEAARRRFRRDHVGLIFQDFLLFEELTAAGNAGLAAGFAPSRDRPALRRRGRDWLARLGLRDTGRRVDSFSGGERQRVAVARALANDARLVLADEPTASLDRAAADRLIADLALLPAEGRTLIAVTHDAALIARLDRVLTLAEGRIVEDSDG
ncbi:putative ABC transport system ATP-binding protein [Cereibacter changlensis]|uniref:Putative ABC transport system ATP-binding protein n=3 Tax=Cereibacter changlensis TaxID=402884 RepID=A0A2W7QQG2_9RHOB|nr:ATP-binding cassette domain-containing protein [Cereibacter changlensis]PZX49516.1 putative ABC transport system ATP-binding protein [Cereibacter changlensis]